MTDPAPNLPGAGGAERVVEVDELVRRSLRAPVNAVAGISSIVAWSRRVAVTDRGPPARRGR